jgi:hypothetical protein
MEKIDRTVQEARSSKMFERNFRESDNEGDGECDMGFGDRDLGNEETSTVEMEPLKRSICRAIVESETGAELDDKLMKMDIMLGRNGKTTESSD